MSEPTVVKRLHVSGLIPTITHDHLRDRFKSFGTVLGLDAPGPDALGEPRKFVYLDIETTPAQLRKCLNIMSGAHWRGAQLRLAEAKPRYDVKYASTSTPSKVDEERRRRKRLRRAEVQAGGKHAQDMHLVTNPSRGKFWKLEDGHLVRPIAMRPSHPLPAALRSEEEQKAKEEKGKGSRRPMKRMPRRVIDPERWGATHEVFADEEVRMEEGWEWESVGSEDEEEDEEGRLLLGSWRRGEERSPVYGRIRPTMQEDLYATEESDSESDVEVGSRSSSPMFPARDGSASPLFPTRTARERSASPLFPTRAERSASPLFPTRTERDRSASPLFPSRPPENESDKVSSRSASPLFPTRPQTGTRSGSSSPLFPSRS